MSTQRPSEESPRTCADAWNFVRPGLIGHSGGLDGWPLGNGDIGALMSARYNGTSFLLAKSTLWDERCDDGNGGRKSFQPFNTFSDLRELIGSEKWDEIDEQFEASKSNWRGKFFLLSAGELKIDRSRFENEVELVHADRRLNLASGTANSSSQSRVRGQSTEAFVSVRSGVLAIRERCTLTPAGGAPHRTAAFGMDISFDVELIDEDAVVTSGYSDGMLWQRVQGYDGLDYLTAAMVVGGEGEFDHRRLTMRGAGDEITIFSTIVDGREHLDLFEEAHRQLDAAIYLGYDSIKKEHHQWWAEFWSASTIEIPDPDVLRQYHFGLYLLGSSSRIGRPMPGLLGLWVYNPGSGWNEYTNDLNIQMNYWPVYASNHLDLALPYYHTTENWLPEARRYTRDYWDCQGVQFSCCCSREGLVAPGYLPTMHWAGYAAFVSQNFWTHYQFSHDQAFLRDTAYPFLKECAEFYLDFLRKGNDGLYEIWPSNTPESGEGSHEAWGKNPTMDIALIRSLFEATIEGSETLYIDEKLRASCRERLDNFPPYPRRAGRLADMESKDFIYSHRHPGLLTPIYPCSDIAGEIAHRTFDEFVARGDWLWVGFSPVWAAAAAARLGRGEQALELLQHFMEVFTLRDGGLHLNYDYSGTGRGMAGEKCFTNEANSGFSDALLEMLLQSHNDVIQVFPAVPQEWADVSFRNLRARGAHLVSAILENGLTADVHIHCEKDGPVSLRNPWCGGVVVRNDSQTVDHQIKTDILTWHATAGQTFRIVPETHCDGSPQILARLQTLSS